LKYTHWTHGSKLVDELAWDGSDFFMVWPLPKFIFAADRVRSFITKQELKGVTLEPVSEMKPSPFGGPGLSPGRLSDYFPKERAKEVGHPLGID
jgi:hypothetical protein